MLSSNRAVFQLLQRTHVAVIPRFASAVATNRRSEPVTEAQLKMYPVIGELDNFLNNLFSIFFEGKQSKLYRFTDYYVSKEEKMGYCIYNTNIYSKI